MAKIVIDKKRCKGCQLCMTFCPGKAIGMSTEFNEYGYHPAVFLDEKKCTGCGHCYLVCPDIAIEVYR